MLWGLSGYPNVLNRFQKRRFFLDMIPRLSFVLSVRCLPLFFSKVNMKAFKSFCIIVISGTKKLDGFDVVKERMEFGDVDVLSNAYANKKILVLVKRLQSVLEVSLLSQLRIAFTARIPSFASLPFKQSRRILAIYLHSEPDI